MAEWSDFWAVSDAQFEVPLDALLARSYEHTVPSLVKDLLYYLCKCVRVRGLFRVEPAQAEVADIARALNQRTSRFVFKYDNPHIAASLLKKFIAEIPGGLIPRRALHAYLNSQGDVEELRGVVRQLSASHRVLLHALLTFFQFVSSYSVHNEMDIEALSYAWGPTLAQLVDPDDPVQLHLSLMAFRALCLHKDDLFTTPVKTHTLVEKEGSTSLSQHKRAVLARQVALQETLKEYRAIIAALTQQLHMAEGTSIEKITQRLRNARAELEEKCAELKCKVPLFYVPSVLSVRTLAVSGHFSLQGRRASMEDRVIHFDNLNIVTALLPPNKNRAMYAVYDGHSGDEVAILAEQHLHNRVIRYLAHRNFCDDALDCLNRGIKEADEYICAVANAENLKSGSTMVVVYIEGETLYVANLGDSEAIMGARSDDGLFSPVVLSKKHKPGAFSAHYSLILMELDDQEEVDRMVSGGALVARGRVFGKLAVSRALGDSDFKMPKATCNHVSNDSYLAKFALTHRNDFLVIACDGLWDVVTYQQAVDIVAAEKGVGTSAEKAAEILAQASFDGGSQDNISVIVVYLNWEEI